MLRLLFQYLRQPMVASRDPLLVRSPLFASRHQAQLLRTSQLQIPTLLLVACPSRAATATCLACPLQMVVLRSMAAVAFHFRFRTTLRHHTDRAQRAQRHPTTHLHRTIVLHPRQALLATFRQRMVAARLFPLRPPPLSLLQPRHIARRTATGTTPTPMVPSTPYTAARTSPVRPSTLRTAAKPRHTLSSRVWLSATNTPLVLRPPQMVRAVTSSARSLALQVALALWPRTRCLALRHSFRLSLYAPTK